MTNWKVVEGALEVLEVEEVVIDVSEYARREETKTAVANIGVAAVKLATGGFVHYATTSASRELRYDRYWFEVGGNRLHFDLLVTDQARKPPLPEEFSTATRARAVVAEEEGLLQAAAIILPEKDAFFWCSYYKAGRNSLVRRYLRGIGYISLVWATLLVLAGLLWQLVSSEGAEWWLLGILFVTGFGLAAAGSVSMLWEDWRPTAEVEPILRIIGFRNPSSVNLEDRALRKYSWDSDSGEIDFMYRMPT